MSANTISISDPRNAAIINDPATGSDWRAAAKALIGFWIEAGRCLSSGEVAACLREHNPNLRFSVPSLGETVRDLFYNQALPQYANDGIGEDDGTGTMVPTGPVYASQVARMTEGLYPDRTPANVQVFVYGPNSDACYEHPFEVFIPRPKADGTMETQADAPVVTVTPPATPAVQAKKVVRILGVQAARSDLIATVRNDSRLIVPRNAFELAVGLGGQPMRGGDPVFVKVSSQEAIVSLKDPGDGLAKSYNLTSSSGRVAFYSADPTLPFTPGDSFRVTVTAGCLTIDLTNKV
jgi:hypothetical protein